MFMCMNMSTHARMHRVLLLPQVSFNWTWSKGPLSGSGYGELALAGGPLD